MKRLALIVVAIAVLLAALLVVLPTFVADDLARARISDQITQWIGRPVTFSGEPEISVFPSPRVVLRDVVIEDGDGSGRSFITVEELTGSVAILPLLLGRIEIRSFELTRPTIALRVNDDGVSNWFFEGGTLGARIAEAFDEAELEREAGVDDEVDLGAIRIREGTITYEEPGLEPAVLSDVSLDLTWPKTSSAATAEGSLVWRDELLDISASLSDPLELIANRTSPGRFTIVGDPVRIDFNGVVGRTDLDFSFAGETDVTMRSFRRTIQWAGSPITDGTTLGPARISGSVSWAWPVLSFSSADMTLDGNAASGALSVDFSGERLSIDGTFAATTLDLRPYVNSFQADLTAGGPWVDTQIALPVLDTINTDIRVSADQLLIGATHVEAFAASLIINDGLISFRLGQSQFYGGTVEINVRGSYEAQRLALDAHLEVHDVNARPMLSDIFGVTSIRGLGSVVLDTGGEGATWGRLVDDLTGTLTAELTDGSVEGIDIPAMVAMPNPVIDALDAPFRETQFATIAADLSFNEGWLVADSFEAHGTQYDLTFEGRGALTAADLEGAGTLNLQRPNDLQALQFLLIGTWLEPRFVDVVVPASPLSEPVP